MTETVTHGRVARSWTTEAKRWAEVRPLAGTEAYEAKQVNGEVTHEVSLRHYAGLTPTDYRILYGTRVFEILGVTHPDERGKETQLTCKEAT